MHPDTPAIIVAKGADGRAITATYAPLPESGKYLLTITDGQLALSCATDQSLLYELRDPTVLAAKLMRAAGAPPDGRACAAHVKALTLQWRRARKIDSEQAHVYAREAAGLIEEAQDEDNLPDLLMETFWGNDWPNLIPRLPESTRQRIAMMAAALFTLLEENAR